MSAFGYGQNYDPNQVNNNGNMPATSIAQTVPGYQPTQAPPQGASAINWNPTVATPWQDPGYYISSYDNNTRGGLGGDYDQATGKNHYNANYTQYPWTNVVRQNFGQGSFYGVGGPSGNNGDWNYTQPTAMQQTMQGNSGAFAGSNSAGASQGDVTNSYHGGGDWERVYQYQNGTQNQAYTNQYSNNANDQSGSASNPQTLQELYSQMQGLGQNDLMSLTNRFGSVQQGFQNAANEFGAAYQNTNYAKENPWSQQTTSDWLQASYNTLTGKLQNAALLY